MQALPRNDSQARKNLWANIHRLPNEILGYIFTLGCPALSVEEHRGTIDPRPFQVLVSSICRLWRDVAHGTPALWTMMFIRLPIAEGRPSELCEILLQDAFDRSGLMDLALYVVQREGFHMRRRGFSTSPRILSIIKEIFPRLNQLYLNADVHTTDIESIFPITDLRRSRNIFLNTRNTRLSQQDFIREFTLIDGSHVFEKAETFEIYLHRYSLPEKTAFTSLASLRKLTCHSDSINEDLTNTVTKMPRLEHLSLTGPYVTSGIKSISSSSLIRLELHLFDHSIGSSTILEALDSLPKLTHFTLITGGNRVGRWTRLYEHSPRTHDENRLFIPCLMTLLIGPYGDLPYCPLTSVGPVIQHAPNLAAFELWDSDAMDAIRALLGSDERLLSCSYPNLRLIRVVFSPRLLTPDYMDEMTASCRTILERRPNLRMEWYFRSPLGRGQGIPRYIEQPPDGALFCGAKSDNIPSLETALEGLPL